MCNKNCRNCRTAEKILFRLQRVAPDNEPSHAFWRGRKELMLARKNSAVWLFRTLRLKYVSNIKLAEYLGIHPNTVAMWIKKLDEPSRSKQIMMRNIRLCRDFDIKGKSVHYLSRKYNLSNRQVLRILNDDRYLPKNFNLEPSL